MIGRYFVTAGALAGALALAACGDPSKSENLDQAEGIDTKSELEDTLGRPDDVTKVGPLERWTYNASDGAVTFVITGDSVALSAAGGGDGK